MGGDVTPILVIGSARNGTTWLCNILANHPEIAAAQHPAHWGFHESNVFKNLRYWRDLSKLDRRIHFTTMYQQADHFSLVGGTEQAISHAIEAGLTERGDADFYDVFFELMDRFAQKNGTRYWLTKLDPLMLLHPKELQEFLHRLFTRYPRARLVSIQRDLAEVVQSYLNMEGRGSQARTSVMRAPLFSLFETARYLVHYRRIRWIGKHHSTIALTYRQLRGHTADTMQTVCSELSINYDDAMLISRYQPNSSIAYRSKIRRVGPGWRILLDGVFRPLLMLVWPVTISLVRFRERYRPRVPPIYFKLIKLERFPERFREELLAADDTALAEFLFSEKDEE